MNSKICSLLAFFIVICLAFNCFSTETAAKETPNTQESEDVVIVSNPKTPQKKMRIVFTEELSIGEAEGDENYMFGQNIAFNTDEDGNFYVSDLDARRIQKYGPDGKYLLTIGREGQGPGEFGSLSLIRFDKDNNLYINDVRNNRISFFNREGKYIKQMGMTERFSNLIFNSKGFIIANRWQFAQEGNIQKQTSLHGLFDDEFNLVAELFKDEIEMTMPTGRDASSLGDYLAKTYSRLAFRPQVITTVADNDFILLGYPDKYEINIYSPEGNLVKKITREHDPPEVTEKDKEGLIKLINDSISSSVITDDIKEQALKKIKFPKYKPAYQGLALMENGWLAVLVDSVEGEYTLFDIFDQEGKYIAHFKTPVPAEGMLAGLLFFKNGRAYSVVTEDDYKFVKRYSFEVQEYADGKWIKNK